MRKGSPFCILQATRTYVPFVLLLPFSLFSSPPVSTPSADMTSELKANYVVPFPIDQYWKMAKQVLCTDLMLKAMPAVFANIEILEGGGGAGTVRVITTGPAGPNGAGQKVKQLIEVIDESTHTTGMNFLEGGDPRYTNVRFTVHLTPAGDSTNLEWICHYTPVDASVPPPEHYKQTFEVTDEAVQAYAKDHAAEFA